MARLGLDRAVNFRRHRPAATEDLEKFLLELATNFAFAKTHHEAHDRLICARIHDRW